MLSRTRWPAASTARMRMALDPLFRSAHTMACEPQRPLTQLFTQAPGGSECLWGSLRS